MTQFDIYANELLRSAIVNGVVGPDGLAFTIGDTPARVTARDRESVTLTVGDATGRRCRRGRRPCRRR